MAQMAELRVPQQLHERRDDDDGGGGAPAAAASCSGVSV